MTRNLLDIANQLEAVGKRIGESGEPYIYVDGGEFEVLRIVKRSVRSEDRPFFYCRVAAPVAAAILLLCVFCVPSSESPSAEVTTTENVVADERNARSYPAAEVVLSEAQIEEVRRTEAFLREQGVVDSGDPGDLRTEPRAGFSVDEWKQLLVKSSRAALFEGFVDLARLRCEIALERYPEDPGLLYQRGNVAHFEGDGDRAMSWWRKALFADDEQKSLKPEERGKLCNNLAYIIVMKQSWVDDGGFSTSKHILEEALALSKEALGIAEQLDPAIFPRDSLYHTRGVIEAKLDRLFEAERSFRRALTDVRIRKNRNADGRWNNDSLDDREARFIWCSENPTKVTERI